MAAQLVDHLSQRLPVDVLHRIVVDAALTTYGVDSDDVRVLQRSGGVGFVLEPLEAPRIQDRRKGQHLQRHAAAQGNLLHLVHHAHPTATDLAQDPEIAQHAGHKGLIGPHGFGRIRASPRGRYVFQQEHGRHEPPDSFGVLRVRQRVGFQVHGLASLQGLGDLFDQVGQQIVRTVPGISGSMPRAHGWVTFEPLSNRWRRRSIARSRRILTAPSEMLSKAAISATGICSKCRKTRISRSVGSNCSKAARIRRWLSSRSSRWLGLVPDATNWDAKSMADWSGSGTIGSSSLTLRRLACMCRRY